MASSAVLRFACRALQGQPASFPRATVANGERFLRRSSPTPREIIGSGRLYSTEAVRTAELMNPKGSTLDPLATSQSSAHELAKKVTSQERIRQLHETRLNIFKRLGELLREKKRSEIRRRQLLAGGSILTGIAIYPNFFRGSQDTEGSE